ncbi:hypothetical protein JCM8097_002055 [Rhodosporidiobolus ruineniae]
MQRHVERVQRFEALLSVSSSDARLASSGGGASASSPQPDGPGQGAAQGTTGSVQRQDELRRLALAGVPDDPAHLRPRVYAALLCLPPPSSLTAQYSSFLSEIDARISSLPPPASNIAKGEGERYDRLLREIQRDVERTFGGLAWFGAPVEGADGREDALWSRIGMLDDADRRQADELAERESKKEEDGVPPTPRTSTSSSPRTRRQALLRPLFVYAFLNPGVSYVQGMSYLAAILFYVFSSAPLPPSPSPSSDSPAAETDLHLSAEASTFFALAALLSQLRDLYTPTLDGVSSPRLAPHARLGSGSVGGAGGTGLGATVARFNALLLVVDPNVADALERKGVEMGGLCIRWWTTMFANEFTLPDVVRIWDRLLSLYPPESEHHPGEALSPVLGHLIDLSLAIVMLERQKIVSPFARLPEILTALQSPSADVDRLLQTAWDVRERRLGRGTHAKRSSVSSEAATPTKGVFSLGKKLWSSATSTPPRSPAVPSVDAAADYELDDRSSVAGSDLTRPRFGSLAFSSPRSSQDLTGNVTVVDGKVLPPPPARIDQQHEMIASLIEQELAADKALQEPEYGVDEDEDEEQHGSLAERAASGWSGLKSSFSRFASSDTAATLQKRATNLQLAAASASSSAQSRFQSSDAAAALFKAQSNAAAKAQLLREQLAQDAPERIAAIREAAAGAGGRLMASTGSERYGDRAEGSPREMPFTPPGANRHVSPLSSPKLGGGSVDMGRQGSNGPKPLLLSSSARRAESVSGSEWARSPSTSPSATRTPLLSTPDVSIPPLSRSPSLARSHGRSASQFDTPSRPSPSSASAFRPRSSSTTQRAGALELLNEDEPIQSGRISTATAAAAGLRRGGPTSRTGRGEEGSPSPAPGARPAESGRGWTLSDAPIRRPSPSPSLSQSTSQLSSPTELPPPVQLPPLDLGFDPSAVSESVEPLVKQDAGLAELAEGLAAVPLGRRGEQEREEPFVPPTGRGEPFIPPTEREEPVEPPFSPPAEDPSRSSSPAAARGSSLSASTSSSSAAPAPQRTSSLASSSDLAPSLSATTTSSSAAALEPEEPLPSSTGGGLSRSSAKLTRRPPAQRKRTSRSSISTTSASVDLTGAEARRVASDFLSRSSSSRREQNGNGEEGGAMSRRGSHRKRMSESGASGGGSRLSKAEFDEEDFLDAYGEEAEQDGQR